MGFEPYEFGYRGESVVLFDLGGGARVRDIWKHYFSESYGFVFVIDCSSRSRIHECSGAFDALIENERVAGKPILM